MLLQRILTAIPLAFVVIWVIFYQPSEIFVYLLYLIVFIAGYEWALLGGLKKAIVRVSYALLLLCICWIVITYYSQYIHWLIYLSVVFWVVVHVFLKSVVPVVSASTVSPVKLSVAFIVIPAAVYSMYLLHRLDNGPMWLMYGLMLVWVADIGAYFSGKKFGRTKLSDKISPGKTREGMWGALAATSLYSISMALYFELSNIDLLMLLMLSLVLTIISITGDLYESYLKRERGVKDSGRILPGHGGILDRVDSVLAAMPVFVTGCHWLLFDVEGFLL